MSRTRLALVLASTVFLAATPSSGYLGENLVQQPTFDEGINGWDNLAGKLWEQQDDAYPLNVNPNPGCMEMVYNSSNPSDGATQCIGIIGDQEYAIRAWVKSWMTGDAFGKAGISVSFFTDDSCKDYVGGQHGQSFGYIFGATDWSQIKLANIAPLEVHSALVVIGGERTAGTGDSEVRARFDEVIVAPIYFDTTTSTTATSTSTSTTDEPGAPGCADPVKPYDKTTTADALYVLKTAVGNTECEPCYCDADSSGKISTADALRTLRKAVGQNVVTHCGGC
jgi:hypothetical protein